MSASVFAFSNSQHRTQYRKEVGFDIITRTVFVLVALQSSSPAFESNHPIVRYHKEEGLFL